MTTTSIRYVVKYSGYVQGVGFRMTAVAQARGLSVHGFVRNDPDGGVTMDVQGSPADVKELMRRIASAMAENIDSTAVDERPATAIESGFQIRY